MREGGKISPQEKAYLKQKPYHCTQNCNKKTLPWRQTLFLLLVNPSTICKPHTSTHNEPRVIMIELD